MPVEWHGSPCSCFSAFADLPIGSDAPIRPRDSRMNDVNLLMVSAGRSSEFDAHVTVLFALIYSKKSTSNMPIWRLGSQGQDIHTATKRLAHVALHLPHWAVMRNQKPPRCRKSVKRAVAINGQEILNLGTFAINAPLQLFWRPETRKWFLSALKSKRNSIPLLAKRSSSSNSYNKVITTASSTRSIYFICALSTSVMRWNYW